MTRRQRLERNGYKVSTVMNTGNIVAKKGMKTVIGTSVSDVHKQIFGY